MRKLGKQTCGLICSCVTSAWGGCNWNCNDFQLLSLGFLLVNDAVAPIEFNEVLNNPRRVVLTLLLSIRSQVSLLKCHGPCGVFFCQIFQRPWRKSARNRFTKNLRKLGLPCVTECPI